MNAGELDRKITIQRFIKDENSPFGNGTWVEQCKPWAKKSYIKGQEFWAAQANNSEMTVKYIIRFRKNINSEMRVVDREGTYEIIAPPQPFDTRDYIILLCKEVKPSA